jgi:hypothetical protein
MFTIMSLSQKLIEVWDTNCNNDVLLFLWILLVDHVLNGISWLLYNVRHYVEEGPDVFLEADVIQCIIYNYSLC